MIYYMVMNFDLNEDIIEVAYWGDGGGPESAERLFIKLEKKIDGSYPLVSEIQTEVQKAMPKSFWDAMVEAKKDYGVAQAVINLLGQTFSFEPAEDKPKDPKEVNV